MKVEKVIGKNLKELIKKNNISIEKVSEVIVTGKVKAPRSVVSLIQFLSSSIAGEITVLEEEEKNEQE